MTLLQYSTIYPVVLVGYLGYLCWTGQSTEQMERGIRMEGIRMEGTFCIRYACVCVLVRDGFHSSFLYFCLNLDYNLQDRSPGTSFCQSSSDPFISFEKYLSVSLESSALPFRFT